MSYCNTNQIIPNQIQLNDVLKYLTFLHESGLSYSSINTARSTLSLMLPHQDGKPIGEHPLIVRLLRGVARQRPPTPKYSHIWNVDVVLSYIKKMTCNDKLDMMNLSIKLVGLLALASGQRVQTLAAIRTQNIKFSNDSVNIFISDTLKTSGINNVQPCISFPTFKRCKALCVKSCLENYLSRTSGIRKTDYLFITTTSPYRRATSQTLSKWLVKLLDLSGVNTDVYKSHSFRHSSTSKAFKKGVSVNSIYNAAGWTSKSRVFGKFYNRNCEDVHAFAHAVLNK